jgi:hypothetical protein
MKVSLDVRMHSEGLKPFATLHLRIPSQRVRGSMVRGILWAFVDTGSPYTIISETDSERLRIQISGTPRRVWLGGAQLYNYDVRGVVLKVICEDKKTIWNISMPIVGVIRPIPNVARSAEVSRAIPSIIGVDLLQHYRLALYFDAHNKISYLEKV